MTLQDDSVAHKQQCASTTRFSNTIRLCLFLLPVSR